MTESARAGEAADAQTTPKKSRAEVAEAGTPVIAMTQVSTPSPVPAGRVPSVGQLQSQSNGTVIPNALPNLVPYAPSGYSDKIVVSSGPGTHTDNTLYTGDTLYVDWTILNNSSAATTSSYYIQLWVDDVYWTYWIADPGLGAYYYNYIDDYSLGTLSGGWHTVRIVADPYNSVAEGNEYDNSYTKSFYVNGGLPNLTPYQPSGWSNKIVLSHTTGANSDTTLYTSNPIYIDWAVLNNGAASAGLFNTQIWVDGVYRNTWATNASLPIDWYTYVYDYSIGSLSAGWHTIEIVSDSGYAVGESNEGDNRYTRTFYVNGGLPNLTPYQPAGWSNKLVVSNVVGTNTDSATLLPGQALYLDWAVINNGATTTTSSFALQIWVDGVLKVTWNPTAGLDPNYYYYIHDYALGAFSAGTHTVKVVVDPFNTVSEGNETTADNTFERTFAVVGLPNLIPHQPAGWSGKLPISNVTGTTTDAGTLVAGQTLYLDWAVLNNGVATTTTAFNVQILVDGVLAGTWSAPAGLYANYYDYVNDFPIGPFSAGSHYVKIIADSGGTVSESIETDNQYLRTFNVTSSLPNLTPYQPSGWSNKIVVSNSTGTTTDGALAAGQTVYVDWAILNNGSATAGGPWSVQLWVDGVLRTTWAVPSGLPPGSYSYVNDYSIGPLSGGSHWIKIVADSGSVIGESNEADNVFTRDVVVAASPNMRAYQPSGWSDEIVVSSATGTTTDGTLLAGQPLYVDWAALNDGAAPASYAFYVQLLVDGVVRNTWLVPAGLASNYYSYVMDYAIGSLSAGTHTVKIVIDPTNAVGESNEGDNSYTKTITVTTTNTVNLVPFKPGTWSDKLVVSNTTGTTTDPASLPAGQPLYLDWSVANGGNAAAPTLFYVQILVDGVSKNVWSVPAGFGSGAIKSIADYPIGSLAAGTHTVKIITDTTGAVGETNEADNTYTKTINVGTVSGADIRVQPLTISFTAPTALMAGEEMLQAPPDHMLYLKSGVIDPLVVGTPRESLSYVRAERGGRHVIAQFQRELSPEEIDALGRDGIRVLGYIPNYAYWVSTSTTAKLAGAAVGGGLRAVFRPDPAVKATLALDPANFPPDSRTLTGTITVRVRAFADVDADALSSALLAAGFPDARPLHGNVHELTILPVEIERLAELDVVEWIEPAEAPKIPYNATAAERILVATLPGAPYYLTGSTVTVGIWDAGRVDSHSDFGSRLFAGDSASSVHYHATHVAGTIGGSGAGNWNARGEARASTLWSYDWNSDTTEMRAAPSTRNIRISNHSYGIIAGWFYNGGWVDYGTANFGLYDSTAAEWDDIVADTGLTVFKAAGNDRSDGPDWPVGPRMDGPFDTISTYGNAKNIITVCATDDADGMSSFSSWGPTNDGRVKPDVCANGVGLLSTYPGNTYSSISGTSMATPSAAGGGALLLHQLNGLGVTSTPDLLKALLIHGAKDLGRPGPDYEYGWGILNVTTSVLAARNATYVRDTISSTSDKKLFAMNVPSGTSQIRVTLVWTDPAGSPAASKALVNDLDLVLVSPSGTVVRPWILNPASPSANATRGVNHTDNVEQVVVSSPEAGQWTVKISGYLVPSGPQKFTAVGSSALTPTFSTPVTIYNDGSATLNITQLALQTAGSWISWTPAAPFTVSAGQSKVLSVMVNFNNAPAGTSSRRLLISSNDPDENPVPNGVNVNVQK